MSKQIEFENDAREILSKGVKKLNQAVGATMGPRGRYVLIGHGLFGKPHPTKDGVTVAKEVSLPDEIENLGVQVVRQAAEKTADEAGDGTTTATVLAAAIIELGMVHVKDGIDPMLLRKGIDRAVAEIVEQLKDMSEEVDGDNDKIKSVATISANNDVELGTLIASAFEEVGHDGIVTTKESKTDRTYVEIKSGAEFGRGFMSPYFINTEDAERVEYDNPFIIIVGDRVDHMNDLLPALEACVQAQRPIVIIADEFNPEVVATLVVNKRQGHKVVTVKAPYAGENRKKILQDLAVVTGGKVITSETGNVLSEATIDMFGGCEKVVITKDSTQIVSGYGDDTIIPARVQAVKDSSEGPADEEIITRRVAILNGKAAILHVGARTEAEIKEKTDRVDDALSATRAAIKEGIVPGGGTALLRCAESLKSLYSKGAEEAMGIKVIAEALVAPITKIIRNGGGDPEPILKEIMASNEIYYGYNVQSEEFVHLNELGIFDPTMVTRVALENAASVASMILTTDCTITNLQ